METGIMSINI